MDRKAGFLFCVLLAGILWPLGRIWETWHREPVTCPPCLTGSTFLPKAQTGTCGSFKPMLNATCPDCGTLWYDARSPEYSETERALDVIPRSRVATVFSEPRLCAMEGVYFSYLYWPWPR